MLIIPVIDLYAGNVVHARAGQRKSYQNISTPLCHGSEPALILQAILSLHPFTTVYIADLNAIKNEGNNNAIIDELLKLYPDVCFWLDSGKYTYPDILPASRLRHVIGSETGVNQQQLHQQRTRADSILSLDFLTKGFIGEPEIIENAVGWPDDIIIMSLNRVGTNQGPDITLLNQIKSISANKRFYVAGGVRDDDDLKNLQNIGVSGVLMATALHQRRISSEALHKYSTTSS
jgi:phosphoribosylformimino-5-aminoimidazole carboxamide ribotide isomerase